MACGECREHWKSHRAHPKNTQVRYSGTIAGPENSMEKREKLFTLVSYCISRFPRNLFFFCPSRIRAFLPGLHSWVTVLKSHDVWQRLPGSTAVNRRDSSYNKITSARPKGPEPSFRARIRSAPYSAILFGSPTFTSHGLARPCRTPTPACRFLGTGTGCQITKQCKLQLLDHSTSKQVIPINKESSRTLLD